MLPKYIFIKLKVEKMFLSKYRKLYDLIKE